MNHRFIAKIEGRGKHPSPPPLEKRGGATPLLSKEGLGAVGVSFWRFLLGFLVFSVNSSASAADFDPRAIFQNTAKSVVLITAFDSGEQARSMGTGSIIDGQGLVITNAHVIFNTESLRPFQRINVYLKPERVTGNLKKDTALGFNATLLQLSEALDLALVSIDSSPGSPPFPVLRFANPERVEIGDPVVAIGHPEQGGLWTLTTGTISSSIEDFEQVPGKNVFQTEASINRGNSGGPLIDKSGHMVAINSNIARQSADGLAITAINFSIKSSVAVQWLKSAGYPFAYADLAVPAPGEKMVRPKTGIVPVPDTGETPKAETAPPPKTGEGPRILTERRPFTADDLFKQVETEMEDMMRDMRGKLRKKRF
ncbi:MAG: trypsin-like peptidase domain-containing protein [Nitrospinae bacterium]|nr:trypsin-like peptidase domain-containing protein [Nitrospinota bacterium]